MMARPRRPSSAGTWPSSRSASAGPCRAAAGLAEQDSAGRVSRFYQAWVALTPRADVTRLVLLANIGIFAAMVATGVSLFDPKSADLLKWGANKGIQTTAGQWWRLFTA